MVEYAALDYGLIMGSSYGLLCACFNAIFVFLEFLEVWIILNGEDVIYIRGEV